MIFYREWLPLDKQQFAIMAMLADKGKFKGTISAICDYFGKSRNDKNIQKIRSAIDELETSDFITVKRKGRTLTIEVVPKEEVIETNKEWYDVIRLRSSPQRSIAWEIVLKVHLWTIKNDYDDVVKNSQIALELNTSEDRVSQANTVLKEEFGATKQEDEYYPIKEGKYRKKGHHVTALGFWNKDI